MADSHVSALPVRCCLT